MPSFSVYQKETHGSLKWHGQIKMDLTRTFSDEIQAKKWIEGLKGPVVKICQQQSITVKCAWCKKEFQKINELHNKRYCSRKCVYIARLRRKHPIQVKSLCCEWCGMEFQSLRKRRFCSLVCNLGSWQARNPDYEQQNKRQYKLTKTQRREIKNRRRIKDPEKFRRERREQKQRRRCYLKALETAMNNLGLIPDRPKIRWTESYLLTVEKAAKQLGLV